MIYKKNQNYYELIGGDLHSKIGNKWSNDREGVQKFNMHVIRKHRQYNKETATLFGNKQRRK